LTVENPMPFKQSFAIGEKLVGGGAPCLVIGEIGPNHDGDQEKALALIDACAEAGCHGVKFQYHIAEAEIFDRMTKSYYYDETRYNFIKRVQEFPHNIHGKFRDHAVGRGLLYLCSVFSEAAAEKVSELAPDGFKIPSGEVGNPWLLEKVARYGKPLIVSSGMSPAAEIDGMMTTLGAVSSEVVLLHCLSEYPTLRKDMHLRVIPALHARYGCPVGLSDHSRNIQEVAASVALGGCMIEVHVTFDRDAKGPDHHVSLLPNELMMLVSRVRELEEALGRPGKMLGAHAQAMRGSFTNSIVASRAIRAGECLSRENLTLMKPGTGLSPAELPKVLGRAAARDLEPLTAIRVEDLK
jgi:N,N'-diacetyllegionaminate synthase